MKTQHFVLRILFVLVLAGLPAAAQTDTQSQGDQSKSSAQSAGTDTKDAAKDVGSATKSGTIAAADKVTGKIDINSARKEDLMKLNGVGEAISTKIIAGRPYSSKRDLLTRKIVNQATYAKISDKIVAHGGPKPSAAAQ
jgi:DNA uptake protein ComE-like DNA-binding protein